MEDVYYERWVNRRKRFIIGDLSHGGDVMDIAMGWAAGLLEVDPEERATITIRPRFNVHDDRDDKSVPLPKLEDARQR